MFRIVIVAVLLFSTTFAFAQYDFKTQNNISCTSVKSQQRTNTCWSFSTTSFIESELLRMGKGDHDLSEMFIVRQVYQDKARNYLLRQGKANFSDGSLSHDVMNALEAGGIVPENVYAGKLPGNDQHDHREMSAGLKGFLDGIRTQKRLSENWMTAFTAILNAYLGAAPSRFEYDGKSYSPTTFAASLGINPADYVEFSSFSHHPFYETFILEVPDNYSNGSYYNVPLDDLQRITEFAIENGYTVAWDGDVSEKGFSAREGMAIVPTDDKQENIFEKPVPEVQVTQANRQAGFMNLSTTDDHLMHITGTATDANGTLYFTTKNSWGEISDYKGFLYMSAAYFRLKTVGIMVHKEAIPNDIRAKLNL